MTRRELVENSYAELKKEHDLPPLKEVEAELDYFAKDLPVMRHLLLFMLDEVNIVAGHLFAMMNPNNLVQEVEYGFYNDKDRKNMVRKHAELVSFAHEITAGVYSLEKEQAETLKKAYEKFVQIKKYAKTISEFHAKKWLEEHAEEEKESRHFG